MTAGYEIKGGLIIIKRELTELDLFLRDFINVLKKHCDYLVVSGFVSISTGRARGTEDIDVLAQKPKKEKFAGLFRDLTENSFWCYQGDSAENVFAYIDRMIPVRFARKGEMFPNAELIPIDESKKAQFFEFSHPQRIRIMDFEFKIPPLEFEILYKEMALGGKKDIEDAWHLRTFFYDILKEDRFREYKAIIGGSYDKT